MSNKMPSEAKDEGLYPPLEEMELGVINQAFAPEAEENPTAKATTATTSRKFEVVRVDEDAILPAPDSDSDSSSTSDSSTTDSDEPPPPAAPSDDDASATPAKTAKDSRDRWDSQIEFLLSCVAMSVGLGNVWRFPFTAYENGGGAFLVPYMLVLVFLGRPMYYLEMCLGQFSSLGPVKMWEISPFFKGVGYASMIGACCTASFYCSIMAVTVYYLFLSFSSPLPWSEEVCKQNISETLHPSEHGICPAFENSNRSFSELYYFSTVFPQLDDIEDGLGLPHGKLLICLGISWTVIYVFLTKGIKSAGKVSYFTALFPYVVLIALLIRGITLDGAIDGIYYFVKPDWTKLLDGKVWFAAVSQCFFSLNVGFGTIVFLSSHNQFRHNVYRDAIVISITDTLTSCLAGCAIFAMLGYLAKAVNVPVSEVTRGGPALAFIAFPESIARLRYFPQGFAVLFFLMLFTLGVGSAIALAGQLITIIRDQFPTLKKWKVALGVSIMGFISGIVYVTPGGQFILTLVNHNGADFIIYITAMLEIIAVSWVYGVNRFCDDIKFMLGRETEIYWKICWAFIMPVGLFGLLLYFFAGYNGLTHEGTQFPRKALVCGWGLSALILSVLPICAIDAVRKSPGDTLLEKLKASFKPLPSWGPKSPAEREGWFDMKTMKELNQIKQNTDQLSNASTVPPTSINTGPGCGSDAAGDKKKGSGDANADE